MTESVLKEGGWEGRGGRRENVLKGGSEVGREYFKLREGEMAYRERGSAE